MSESRRRRRAAVRHGRAGRPPAQERDSRRAARREELLDAAVAAVEALGVEATMTAMAAEAGVTKPVLYRYFGHRAGLYEALAERFVAGLFERLRPALDGQQVGREAVEAAVEVYFAHVESHQALYRFLAGRLPTAGPAGQDLERSFVQRVAAQIADALTPPLQAAGVDPAAVELVAFGMTGAVHLAGEVWLERGAMSREESVARVADLLWGGLGSVASGQEGAADGAK